MSNPQFRHPRDEASRLFLEGIAPYETAYEDPLLCFLASLREDKWHIVRGGLYLAPVPQTPKGRTVRVSTIAAGAYPLSELGIGLREMLTKVSNGHIDLPNFDLIFDHPGTPSVLVGTRFNDSQDQARTVTMTFLGDETNHFFDRPDDDWRVRGGNPPYDSLDELAVDFGVAPIPDHGSQFEVRALAPLQVDYSSPVGDKNATPTVRMSAALNSSSVALGLRIMSPTGIERQYLNPDVISWSPDPTNPRVLVGRADVEVPKEAVIGCYASYEGVVTHYGWLRNPSTYPNPNRAVFEVFDPNMSKISKLLNNRPGRDKGAQNEDLEDAIAHILWVMGFGVSQVGRNKVTSDAVDIVARTPKGHYVLVEATTGPMKTEGKLANLQRRSSEVKRSLAESGHPNLRVVPVFVTTLPAADIAHDMKEAELTGVRVLTWEDLQNIIETRTLIAGDPDALVEEMITYLESLHTN